MTTKDELAKQLVDLSEQSRSNIENMKYISSNMNDAMLKAADISIALTKLCFELIKRIK